MKTNKEIIEYGCEAATLPEVRLYAATIIRAIDDVELSVELIQNGITYPPTRTIRFSDTVSAVRYLFAVDEDKMILPHLEAVYGEDWQIAHKKLKKKIAEIMRQSPQLKSRFKDLLL